MSIECMTWALKVQLDRSSTKFVLVILANCANVQGECWPSVQYLCEATGQDRKTVLANIQRLKELGYISDTGERRGRTGQVMVYFLHEYPQPPAAPETVPKTEPLEGAKGADFGTVAGDSNSTVFPIKQSRFSVETVPKTGHGTERNPKEPNTPLPPSRGATAVSKKPNPETAQHPTAEPPGFSAFRAAFPRWRSEPLALRAWQRLDPSPALQARLLAALELQARGDEWQREKGRYVPKPSTWLARQSWRDEVDAKGTPPPVATVVPPPVVLTAEQLAANKAKAGALLAATRQALARRAVNSSGVTA